MKISMIKMLAISFLMAGLMGCTIATPVTTVGNYEGLANADPDKGRIFVYRDSSFVGAANQYDVMVNGELAGSLPNGSFFSVNAEPGENKIEPRTLTSFGLGKGSTITVEQGGLNCLKLTLNFCLQCKSADINPTDLDTCKKEMAPLKQVMRRDEAKALGLVKKGQSLFE